MKNLLLNTDSYKLGMFLQLPPETEYVYSYIESRGGIHDQVMFFGLQTFIKNYLLTPITQKDIDVAEKIWLAHSGYFNRSGWEHILNEHGGLLPVVIRSVKEGLMIPTKNVILTIENTDPAVPWLTTWIETALLRAIWYPSTVATNSWFIKQTIKEYLNRSGDIAGLPLKYHDFSARGVSSSETSALGAASHLVNFMGSDTITGMMLLMEDYHGKIDSTCFSIPASEHSTITSWGRENEAKAYANMIEQFGKPGATFAVVSDSYDIYKACEIWGTTLKESIIKSGSTLVIRPDSGDPIIVLPKMFAILERHFGITRNSKGYKVLNNVRIIWGDGINAGTIGSILRVCVDMYGYSADNLAFGSGGALAQIVNRDDQKFAMKCSSAYVSGKWIDVFKDPITDKGKISKKGRVTLFKDAQRGYYTGVEDWMRDELDTVFEDGKLLRDMTIEEIRANSNL